MDINPTAAPTNPPVNAPPAGGVPVIFDIAAPPAAAAIATPPTATAAAPIPLKCDCCVGTPLFFVSSAVDDTFVNGSVGAA